MFTAQASAVRCVKPHQQKQTLSIKRIMLNIILPELFPKISTDPMIDLMT